jgi:hypothetical protein
VPAIAKASELAALLDRLVPPASAMYADRPKVKGSAKLIDYFMSLRLDARVELAGYEHLDPSKIEPSDCERLARGVSGIRGVPPVTADQVAAPADAPRREDDSWTIQAISADCTRVLQADSTGDRVVNIAGKSPVVEGTVALPLLRAAAGSIADEPDPAHVKQVLADPTLGDELVTASAFLRSWPLATAFPFAASPDGHRTVFPIGKQLFLAVDGKQIRMLHPDGYAPAFTPDGAAVFLTATFGDHLDGVFAGPATTGRVAPVPALSGLDAVTPLSATTALAILAPSVHLRSAGPICVVELALTSPLRITKKLACLPDREDLSEGILSPHGTWAVFVAQAGGGWHVRTMEIATHRVVFDRRYDGLEPLVYRAIDDHGLFAYGTKLGSLHLAPASGGERELKVDATFNHPQFCAAGQLIANSDQGIVKLEPAALGL